MITPPAKVAWMHEVKTGQTMKCFHRRTGVLLRIVATHGVIMANHNNKPCRIAMNRLAEVKDASK